MHGFHRGVVEAGFEAVAGAFEAGGDGGVGAVAEHEPVFEVAAMAEDRGCGGEACGGHGGLDGGADVAVEEDAGLAGSGGWFAER